MTHVVHVVHSLGIGGTEHGVINLINGLRGFRHSVVAMTTAGALASELPADVVVYTLGKRPGIDMRAILRLAALLRRLAPDIVHSRNWGAFDAVVGAWLARLPSSVIHGEHGREAADPHGRKRRRNRIRRLLAPLVDRFVTVSFELRRWLIDVVGISANKIVTVHNGVDTQRFSSDGRAAGRCAIGVSPQPLVVGTVGRLDPIKDQLRLLEAFARLHSEDVPWALVVVGDGPDRAALEARACRPDLAGRVHLLGERRDVPLLLKGLDVYALPSLAEGISNTILEAMATGLPVVATRTGGTPELVEDGVTGALVPVGDTEALAAALARYGRDQRLRALHGAAARQRALDRFGLQRMVAAYHDLYVTVAGRQADTIEPAPTVPTRAGG